MFRLYFAVIAIQSRMGHLGSGLCLRYFFVLAFHFAFFLYLFVLDPVTTLSLALRCKVQSLTPNLIAKSWFAGIGIQADSYSSQIYISSTSSRQTEITVSFARAHHSCCLRHSKGRSLAGWVRKDCSARYFLSCSARAHPVLRCTQK